MDTRLIFIPDGISFEIKDGNLWLKFYDDSAIGESDDEVCDCCGNSEENLIEVFVKLGPNLQGVIEGAAEALQQNRSQEDK